MRNILTLEEQKEMAYKKVEAMYHKGYKTDDIARAIGLSKIDTLDIVQKVFVMTLRKTGRA